MTVLGQLGRCSELPHHLLEKCSQICANEGGKKRQHSGQLTATVSQEMPEWKEGTKQQAPPPSVPRPEIADDHRSEKNGDEGGRSIAKRQVERGCAGSEDERSRYDQGLPQPGSERHPERESSQVGGRGRPPHATLCVLLLLPSTCKSLFPSSFLASLHPPF